ncbi:MAG: 4-hydroxy-3-methylbut-2-enyl diphosphate reductase [Candidatus Omnitrophica bacterium]|nr:4-hydroxy-3-methylbut-2-enyl diphosphate reductase [Candidatus Omnitrophota bacterium]
MKISVAKSAGFCFGVKRAITIALDAARAGKVFMLGDIVHNEEVVGTIQHVGIKKIERLTPTKDRILLLRAHGTSRRLIEKARRCGYVLIDATCLMVKEIHRTAQACERKKQTIIVIGDKNHDEVKGIIGNLRRKAIIIDTQRNIPVAALKKTKKACIVVQSTQNEDTTRKIVTIIKKHIPQVAFYNTICKPTRDKQEEIKKMPLKNEVMIIIGSKTSANTKRLYEISRSLNSRSHWISSWKELKKRWFKDIRTVGVTAGASTPEETIQQVVRFLKRV